MKKPECLEGDEMTDYLIYLDYAMEYRQAINNEIADTLRNEEYNDIYMDIDCEAKMKLYDKMTDEEYDKIRQYYKEARKPYKETN